MISSGTPHRQHLLFKSLESALVISLRAASCMGIAESQICCSAAAHRIGVHVGQEEKGCRWLCWRGQGRAAGRSPGALARYAYVTPLPTHGLRGETGLCAHAVCTEDADTTLLEQSWHMLHSFYATRCLQAGWCSRPSSQCEESALFYEASLALIIRILGVQAWQAKKRQGATSSLIMLSASGMLMCLLSSSDSESTQVVTLNLPVTLSHL